MVVRQDEPVETGEATTEWQRLKEEGNKLFMDGYHLKAAAAYTTAIKRFSGSDKDLAVLHSNRCAALIKIAKLQKALQDADKCIELRPDWEKGYFRKGCTLEAMTEFSSALDVFKVGMECAPDSTELGSRVKRLDSVVRKMKRTQKAG